MPNNSAYYGPITRDFRENPIHESHHVPEMHQIAKDEISSAVPELVRVECAKYIDGAVRDIKQAIHYDVNTIVEISFDQADDIFRAKRTKKFVSDAICKAIDKRLDSIRIDI